VDAQSWWVVWAPPRTPDTVTERIADEVGAIMAEPAVRARLEGLAIVPLFEKGTDLDNYIQRDFERAQTLLRLAGVQPE
jgi:tripartite-type tricarboxylate transporter receptor subunit TctC